MKGGIHLKTNFSCTDSICHYCLGTLCASTNLHFFS
nr:MAG TPA: hypothetical protein [Caudoviricetes sp.]